jgi:hypothetical protein
MSRDDPTIDIDQLWVAAQGLPMTHLPAVRDCRWPSLPSSCEARRLLGDHDPGAGRHRRDAERMRRGASGRARGPGTSGLPTARRAAVLHGNAGRRSSPHRLSGLGDL